MPEAAPATFATAPSGAVSQMPTGMLRRDQARTIARISAAAAGSGPMPSSSRQAKSAPSHASAER